MTRGGGYDGPGNRTCAWGEATWAGAAELQLQGQPGKGHAGPWWKAGRSSEAGKWSLREGGRDPNWKEGEGGRGGGRGIKRQGKGGEQEGGGEIQQRHRQKDQKPDRQTNTCTGGAWWRD